MGTNHISGMAEARVVTFCTGVDYAKSQHKADKYHENGRGQGHVTLFNFFGPNGISRLKVESSNFAHR